MLLWQERKATHLEPSFMLRTPWLLSLALLAPCCIRECPVSFMSYEFWQATASLNVVGTGDQISDNFYQNKARHLIIRDGVKLISNFLLAYGPSVHAYIPPYLHTPSDIHLPTTLHLHPPTWPSSLITAILRLAGLVLAYTKCSADIHPTPLMTCWQCYGAGQYRSS